MSGRLGLVPVVVTAAVKAKALESFGKGIASLFGDTKLDKERKEGARLALAKAFEGDPDALRWLLARSGARPVVDIKTAPKSVQHIYRTALRTYYATTGEAAPLDIAQYLGIATVVSQSAGSVAPASDVVVPSRAGMGGLLMVGVLVGAFALAREK